MELKRKCEKSIIDWYRNSEKALLIKGARQVGKTHLIRRVLKELGCDIYEVNLIESPEAMEVLNVADNIDDLITGLSTISSGRLKKGETVIFIDEIQRYKEIVTRVKFLVEEGSFRYVLSGSLLGIELNNIESAPVGYLTTIEMFPLDFEEFLQVTNIDDDTIQRLHASFQNREPVMEPVNSKMLDLFNRYLVVGGMPEAVSRFAEDRNINDVMEIHGNIRDLYKLDFTQYETADKRLLLKNAYDLISSELLRQNKRYIVSDLKKGLHYDRVEATFLWLYNAGVAIPVFNSTEPRIPLKLNKKSSLFKLYLSDVGMLTSEYGMSTKRKLLNRDPALNAGGIYENAIAQELRAHGFDLYYYNSNRLGELDFVIDLNETALPLEIKSGKDYTIHSAINNCLNNPEYEMDEAFVLAGCNVQKKDKVTYLPIYMVMFITKDSSELVLDDIVF